MSENSSDEERRAAEALARALDGETIDDPEVVELFRVAESLRASAGLAEPLGAELRVSVVTDAVATFSPRRRSRMRWVVGGLIAASLLFALGLVGLFSASREQPSRVSVGSVSDAEAFVAPTDGLFDGPFPEGQSSAERADRIVAARTRGYFSALILDRSGPRRVTASLVAMGGE